LGQEARFLYLKDDFRYVQDVLGRKYCRPSATAWSLTGSAAAGLGLGFWGLGFLNARPDSPDPHPRHDPY
jgi:hypothetical protein